MMRQFLSGLFIIACVLSASGQKVGLVLSGGGSRGLAHIGVLKALEDNDIPIDYIAGTSMGAIVGGLYAAGYSPEEIALIVNSGEFRRWASGKLDEKYIYFFKQPPPDASWITMKFDYDSTFQTRFPTSIIAPYQMDFAVVELFSRADALAKGNFDSLFVPFRCVGADIEAGKAVTFSNGNLGKSIRASMTFPFYFKPIKINGKLIFDGGIYNNFPTDVMTEDFNPDFIIGSAVVQNFDPPDEDNVLSHIENMITSKTNYEEIGKNGVLIKPNVRDISILDFSNPAEIIDSGYWATIHIADSLKKMIMRRLPHNELR
ncbi:MAG: patatin-like phospholipase family protein, partial [Bacteroidetes bacterium]|nr:patatin-like phospholipase family protein [Bacteroidota bacterium]